jgi:hypothetical protein
MPKELAKLEQIYLIKTCKNRNKMVLINCESFLIITISIQKNMIIFNNKQSENK